MYNRNYTGRIYFSANNADSTPKLYTFHLLARHCVYTFHISDVRASRVSALIVLGGFRPSTICSDVIYKMAASTAAHKAWILIRIKFMYDNLHYFWTSDY